MEEKTLFDIDELGVWQKEWKNMPEYLNEVIKPPLITATFKFKTQKDFDKFNKLIKKYIFGGQKPFDGMQRKNVKTTWYPLTKKASKYCYTDESKIPSIHNK